MCGTKPSGGHDRVGYGTDDACHVAFRHDFSHRKHAGCPAVDFQYHSGKVVHTGRKEGDDRRLGALILSGMAALLIGLSLKKFKERLE